MIDTSAKVTWEAAQNADGYTFSYGTDDSAKDSGITNVTGTSVELTGLKSNTTYFFKVQSSNLFGISEYSKIQTFTTTSADKAAADKAAADKAATDIAAANKAADDKAAAAKKDPPTIPLNFRISNIESESAKASWDLLSGASSYKISLGTDTNGTNIGELDTPDISYPLKALSPSTKYYIKILALNDAGKSSYSPVLDFTTSILVDTTPPSAPSSIELATRDAGAIISWKANIETDLKGYNIYRKIASTNFLKINSSANLTTSYADTGLVNGTEYFYQVTAIDTTGNESTPSSPVSVTPKDTTPPSIPTALSTSPSDSTVILSWNSNGEPDLLGYDVLRRDSSGQISAKINAAIIKANSFTDTGVTNGTRYLYRIRALDKNGNIGDFTPETDTVPISIDTTPPGPPSGVVAISNSNAIGLSWVKPTDADFAGIIILRSSVTFPTDRSNGIVVYLGKDSTFIDAGLPSSNRFYYSLFSFDVHANLSNGVFISATTQSVLGGIVVGNNAAFFEFIDGNATLIAKDGTYLGIVTSNPFKSDSIMNQFGAFGSQFALKSIFNPFGTYGSKFALYSPYNQFTITPPIIYYKNGEALGYLTKNSLLSFAVDPDRLYVYYYSKYH